MNFDNFDDLKLSVEALSGGKNTVILDDQGMPSIMVRIPKFNLSAVIDGAPNTPHPAFIINDQEVQAIYVSKYQNIVVNDRAYSLPYKDPRVSVNFDSARNVCNAKGDGWHLMTNAEWAAVALWSKQNSTMPRGNNDYGKDYVMSHETAAGTTFDQGGTRTNKVATGSGPKSWAHDNSNEGIFDLNGNVREWVGGLRTLNGELHVIKNNDAADRDADHGLNSERWRAIAAADGSLLVPGSADTLKYDALSTPRIVTEVTTTASTDTMFADLAVDAGITIPAIMHALGLAPESGADYGGRGRFYINTDGERLPARGGHWYSTSFAGVFALNLGNERPDSTDARGLRSAFVEV